MTFILFITVIVLLVVIVKRSKNQQGGGDRLADLDQAYRRGFSDGYQHLKRQLASLVSHDNLELNQLRQLVRDVNITTDSSQPYAAVSAATTVPLSPEQLAADKARRSLNNLNILLYVGSFLIVAAMAVFVTLTMPASVKLFGILAITALFYVVGLVLYDRYRQIRPAAVAFVGTGLAILPFTGFALYSLGGLSAEVSWLLTSIIGLVAYGYAAIKLQSQLVSYLMMAFIISLSLSAVSSLGLATVWYFVVVIAVATILSTVHYLKPGLLPALFRQPAEQTGIVITPVALVASLFVNGGNSPYLYEVLFSLATAYYILVWLESRKYFYEVATRILAHITLLIFTHDQFGSSNLAQTLIWESLLLAQIVYSWVRVKYRQQILYSVELVLTGLAIGLMFMVLPAWNLIDGGAWWLAANLSILITAGIISVWRYRQSGWGYASLTALAILPFVIGRGALEPQASYLSIAIVFLLLVSLVIGLTYYSRRQNWLGGSHGLTILLQVSAGIFAILANSSAALENSGWAVGWVSLALAILFIVDSYVTRWSWIEIIGMVFASIAVGAFIGQSNIDGNWQPIVWVWVISALFYAKYWVNITRSEDHRRDISLIATAVGLVIASALHLTTYGEQSLAFGSAISLLILAIVFYEYSRRVGRTVLAEVAVYVATFGAQRIIGLIWPDISVVVYAHIWAVVIAAVAWKRQPVRDTRYKIAMLFVTLPLLFKALAIGDGWATLFLVEHVAVLVAGVILHRQWLVWWGIVSVIGAVLYFLRGYTMLVLLLLGALLVAFVVWRLVKADSGDGYHKPSSDSPKSDRTEN